MLKEKTLYVSLTMIVRFYCNKKEKSLLSGNIKQWYFYQNEQISTEVSLVYFKSLSKHHIAFSLRNRYFVPY